MEIQFSTIKDFIYMHGFGIYIWMSYACCFLLLISSTLISYLKFRIIKKELRNRSLNTVKLDKRTVSISYE